MPLEELSCAREGRDVIGYFWGANIFPVEEYERRKQAVEVLIEHTGGECVFASYERESWLEATRELAHEPEGGRRCEICFRLQLESAARCGVEAGCASLCTSLTISPHKNVALINSLGDEIARAHGLVWLERVWRKNNGFARSIKMSKELGLFRQNYCGCEYSERGTKKWRNENL